MQNSKSVRLKWLIEDVLIEKYTAAFTEELGNTQGYKHLINLLIAVNQSKSGQVLDTLNEQLR